ncbi:MAG: glycogen synthase [Candidatus Nanopelagicales bacterium]|nr:glycogen synthase [Candidatus Nanopelagicales bacterium]MCF8539510.1 glycogen synthase [Candidatus Nanopelagicales bacterium]MCF8550551.1 glycogen synthase [Candidatus Nanopelagicales bacterium]
MRAAILTREWPPEIYGGAGVHVQFLVPALRRHISVDVLAFGESYPDATAFGTPSFLQGANPALATMGTNLAMAQELATLSPDVVHSHTWYTNFAGETTARMLDIPHIVTAHSLEPLRPWKAEQLGGGYRLSSWVEQSAYASAAGVIAVSAGMRKDILDCYPHIDPSRVHVIHNGIDTDLYRPDPSFDALDKYAIDPATPYVLFVGRITRQKGLPHLLAAARQFDSSVNLVLCASSPDTPEIAAEVADLVAQLRAERGEQSVTWIQEQVPRSELLQLFTHATVFACPSIYEPQGIVNLEAMACETAVVASNVGGIPEVVVDGETGVLVPYDPAEPRAFEHAFADAVNRVVADPLAAQALGAHGRARAVTAFAWNAIAQQTIAVYQSVTSE